jgi:hypothetical protein
MAERKNLTLRSVRVDLGTYNSILEFFGRSPTGIKGADAIRELLYRFGLHCQEQMDSGRVAGVKDFAEIGDFVEKQLEEKADD